MKRNIFYLIALFLITAVLIIGFFLLVPKPAVNAPLQNNAIIGAGYNNRTVVIEKGYGFYVDYGTSSIAMKSNGVLSMIDYPTPPAGKIQFQALMPGDTFINFGNVNINVHVIPSPNKFHCEIALYCPEGKVCYQPCLH